MKRDLEKHPCFNEKKRHEYGRIHLPIAPRCNVQCNFCDRKFDCVNESRPGVTSTILGPEEALSYLMAIQKERKNISVVGIAGPGDPFANPEETMRTLRLVREEYPEMLLCVATNGLNLLPYVEELAELDVSHVTLTINALDPNVGAGIYSWMRYNRRTMCGIEGMPILIANQLEAIKELKKRNIIVKVNSIIIPGINDNHIVEIAREMSGLGVDIFNSIPLYENPGSNFAHIKEPSREVVRKIRSEAEKYLPQMHHCTRCRADAVGLLNEKVTIGDFVPVKETRNKATDGLIRESDRPYIAVASNEGVLVNQHLGEADSLLIYSNNNGTELLESRKTPERGSGVNRWEALADMLSDCSLLLVNGIGGSPLSVLENSGLRVVVAEGIIDEAVENVFAGNSINHMIKRKQAVCGAECSGTAGGCG